MPFKERDRRKKKKKRKSSCAFGAAVTHQVDAGGGGNLNAHALAYTRIHTQRHTVRREIRLRHCSPAERREACVGRDETHSYDGLTAHRGVVRGLRAASSQTTTLKNTHKAELASFLILARCHPPTRTRTHVQSFPVRAHAPQPALSHGCHDARQPRAVPVLHPLGRRRDPAAVARPQRRALHHTSPLLNSQDARGATG